MERRPGTKTDLLSADDPLEAMLARPSDDAPVHEWDIDTNRDGGAKPDLAAREKYLTALAAQPWATDFFACVRRIESLFPELPRVGTSNRSSEDPVRFSQEPSLAFAPSTVWEYRDPNAKSPARLFVNFMGMLGPHGPLPLHLTEYARERERIHKDPTFARFLDVFNHRMLSLFYRAWAVNRMPPSYDRAAFARDDIRADRYSFYIGSLIGLGMESLRGRDALEDRAKLHYAGRLMPMSKSAEGLRAVIEQYTGARVEIEEFVGRWLDLPRQYHCRIGNHAERASCTLGGDHGGAVAGERVWDCQSTFGLRLGPMTLERYLRLLPGTPSHARLSAWIRNYIGEEFSWRAVLVLGAKEVPRTQLGSGSRLGWTSWVRTGEEGNDRADVTLCG